MNNQDPKQNTRQKKSAEVTRQEFIKYSVGTAACIPLGTLGYGCSGNGANLPSTNFPLVVFTDVHFTPFYDPSLFPALNAADASQWSTILQTSSLTAPSAWGGGGDTNYPLLMLTFSNIKQNLGKSPLVIFTGIFSDMAFHKRFINFTTHQMLITCPPQTLQPWRSLPSRRLAFLCSR